MGAEVVSALTGSAPEDGRVIAMEVLEVSVKPNAAGATIWVSLVSVLATCVGGAMLTSGPCARISVESGTKLTGAKAEGRVSCGWLGVKNATIGELSVPRGTLSCCVFVAVSTRDGVAALVCVWIFWS